MKKIFQLLLVFAFVALPVFAAVEIQNDGITQGIFHRINFRGAGISVSNGNAIISNGEAEVLSTTSDTLTSADDGKTIICTANGDNKITLPTAAAGLKYTIVDGNIDSGAGTQRIYIDPQSTDTIVYAPSNASGLDANDRLYSSGTTGDSVTLLGASTLWYVIDMGSRDWLDYGAGN
jgi:hypothetical protein